MSASLRLIVIGSPKYCFSEPSACTPNCAGGSFSEVAWAPSSLGSPEPRRADVGGLRLPDGRLEPTGVSVDLERTLFDGRGDRVLSDASSSDRLSATWNDSRTRGGHRRPARPPRLRARGSHSGVSGRSTLRRLASASSKARLGRAGSLRLIGHRSQLRSRPRSPALRSPALRWLALRRASCTASRTLGCGIVVRRQGLLDLAATAPRPPPVPLRERPRRRRRCRPAGLHRLRTWTRGVLTSSARSKTTRETGSGSGRN